MKMRPALLRHLLPSQGSRAAAARQRYPLPMAATNTLLTPCFHKCSSFSTSVSPSTLSYEYNTVYDGNVALRFRPGVVFFANDFRGLASITTFGDQEAKVLLGTSGIPLQWTVMNLTSNDAVVCAAGAILCMSHNVKATAVNNLYLLKLKGPGEIVLLGYGNLTRTELRDGEQLVCPTSRLVAASQTVGYDFGWACPEEREHLVARVILKGPGDVWLQDSLQDAITQQEMKVDQRRQMEQQKLSDDNISCAKIFVGFMLLEMFAFF